MSQVPRDFENSLGRVAGAEAKDSRRPYPPTAKSTRQPSCQPSTRLPCSGVTASAPGPIPSLSLKTCIPAIISLYICFFFLLSVGFFPSASRQALLPPIFKNCAPMTPDSPPAIISSLNFSPKNCCPIASLSSPLFSLQLIQQGLRPPHFTGYPPQGHGHSSC